MMTETDASRKHYLGLDPALNNTGVALLTLDAAGITRTTCRLSPSKDLDQTRKVVWSSKRLAEFLTKHIQPGDVLYMCIEGPSLGSYSRQDVLGEVRGAFKVVTAQYTDPNNIYVAAPTTLKKFATGHGGSDKVQVKTAMVSKGWASNISSDESDAAALAEMCRQLAGGGTERSRAKLSALYPKKKNRAGVVKLTGFNI